MNNIAIVTDTTADIPKDLTKEISITVIHLYIEYKPVKNDNMIVAPNQL